MANTNTVFKSQIGCCTNVETKLEQIMITYRLQKNHFNTRAMDLSADSQTRSVFPVPPHFSDVHFYGGHL